MSAKRIALLYNNTPPHDKVWGVLYNKVDDTYQIFWGRKDTALSSLYKRMRLNELNTLLKTKVAKGYKIVYLDKRHLNLL